MFDVIFSCLRSDRGQLVENEGRDAPIGNSVPTRQVEWRRHHATRATCTYPSVTHVNSRKRIVCLRKVSRRREHIGQDVMKKEEQLIPAKRNLTLIQGTPSASHIRRTEQPLQSIFLSQVVSAPRTRFSESHSHRALQIIERGANVAMGCARNL